jgi:hypothetical protein
LPVVFYQPETRWGGGMVLLRSYRTAPGTLLSSIGLLGIFTQRSQYSATGSVEHYTAGNRGRIFGQAGWSRFPDNFYGLGNATDLQDEETFTLDHAMLALDLRRRIGLGLYLGPIGFFQKTQPRKLEAGGMLASGDVLGAKGGILAALGGVLSLDRRDRVYSPRRGELCSLQFRWFDPVWGSDYASTRLDIDLRAYRTVAPGHVIALHALATRSGGQPPFYNLAGLGGQNVLRGEYEGRYRDKSRVFGQAEYRFPIFSRLGGALFGGAGQVAPAWSVFAWPRFHASAGGGLRVLLTPEEGIALRFDIGWAEDNSGFYFAFGDAF